MTLQKLAAISVFVLAPACAEVITGQWIIDSMKEIDRVQLTLHRRSEHGSSTNSSALQFSDLRGITRGQMETGASQARFEIVRSAGTFVCEGYFKAGQGAGTFTLQPNTTFAPEMRVLGYDNIPDDRIFAFAVHDVSPQFVREIKGAGIDNVSLDQLLAMRIHGVTLKFIGDLKSLGYNISSSQKLVAMRIHGVSPEMIRELKALGYDSLDADKLVAMRIHGASPEFVKEVAASGFSHPPVDQLIAMRIHGVTPEYIRTMKSRGVNVTIQKLIEMRIHGIDD